MIDTLHNIRAFDFKSYFNCCQTAQSKQILGSDFFIQQYNGGRTSEHQWAILIAGLIAAEWIL